MQRGDHPQTMSTNRSCPEKSDNGLWTVLNQVLASVCSEATRKIISALPVSKTKGEKMDCINIWCMAIISVAVGGGILHRFYTKKGIGVRFCQFLGIAAGVPTIIMLAMNDKLEKHTIGALIGVIVGALATRRGQDEAKD